MAGIFEDGKVIRRFVTPMSVASNQPVFVADTLSLARQVVSREVQRWEITTNIEPSNDSPDLLIHSVVNGYAGVFDILMPQVYRPKFVETRARLIKPLEAKTAGVNTFSTLATPVSSRLLKGEFIRFTNHSKIYLITNIVTVDTTDVITIFPKLVRPIATTESINYGQNVILKARYDTDTMLGITYTDGVLSDMGTVTFIEAL